MITTFEQRIQISGMIINGDIKRFNLHFNSDSVHYMMLSLSAIMSMLIWFGRVIEAHNQVNADRPLLQLYILLKVIFWSIKYLLGGRL